MKLYKHFDFTNDTSLDTNYWNVAVGDKWANAELQRYVDSEENLYFKDGLVIKATLKDGKYDSSRINTKGKFAFKYGKIDIVAKVPKGVGTWPALWLMPVENKYGHWPKSGEIDLMEHVGRDLDTLFFCLHTEEYNHTKDNDYKEIINIPGLSDDFHKFGLEWTEESITYYLDDKLMVKYTKGENGRNTSPKGWPFDEQFYLIINLAIGGKFGGNVDDSCFPQEFIVKDIKIYK